MKSENTLRAVVSVSSMCRMLNLSRSQFYFHLKRGTFHTPLHLASNQRPYFTASMVEDNLQVRQSGIGVNGEYVIFYERQSAITRTGDNNSKADHSSLMNGLRSLGLSAVSTEQVEAAISANFPSGTSGHDESTVLRVLFRSLKRSGAA